MELISEIEIGYFRSIYKINISNVSDMNVFFGRNDSGKSNILRALNLFFNGDTNPNLKFNFQNDFCHARLEETEKSAARRKVYIKITFNTPSSWERSLGKSFYVKKSWSVQRKQDANFESSIKEKGKQIYLTRFLNSIRFIYVPAIKDRVIFSELLAAVYGILSKDVTFNESLGGFAAELEKNTQEISSKIFNSLAIKSNISPPSDLTMLFKSLDFDTTNKAGDRYSLTLQHGDGIQARHIPALLAFISDNDDYSFNIWGFEEPENSLELAAAFDEAKSLLSYSMQDNKQVFVTSHSAAFFSLSEKNVTRRFVFKEGMPNSNRVVSKIKVVTDGEIPSEMMGETPLLPVVSNYLKEYALKVLDEERKTAEMEAVINSMKKPLLFVEGEADRILVQGVCDRLYPDGVPFEVVSGDGTTKMESLAKDGKVLLKASGARRIGILVDNDRPGRSLLSNSRLDGGGKWIDHNSNKTCWCRLPFLSEFIQEYEKIGIQKHVWPAVMENCFSKKFRLQAIKDGQYKLADLCYDEILEDKESIKKITNLFSANDEGKLYFWSPHPDFKVKFSNYVLDKTKNDNSEIDWLIKIIKDFEDRIKSEGAASAA